MSPPSLDMSRREAVRRIALLLGGAVVASDAILRGAAPDARGPSEPFTRAELDILDEIGEAIIPATDIPGAKATGIGAFMAMMVADCYGERDRAAFRDGIARVDQASESRFGRPFVEASPAQRGTLAADLDAERAAHEAGGAEGGPAHFFRMMKELTVLGYFSSEVGGTLAVRYVEVPGRFDADIPYRKGDRAWF